MRGPSRILLIDDEASIRRSVVPLLRSRGYEVEAASTAREALSSVAGQPFDLIILDLGLPDMDGLDVCVRLRESSEVPIIVLSARGAEQQKVAALDWGADDYVTKPFGPEELLARIRAALRRSQSDGESESGRMVRGDLTIDFGRHRVYRQGEENPAHPEGIRPPHASGRPCRTGADPSRNLEGRVGTQRRRPA